MNSQTYNYKDLVSAYLDHKLTGNDEQKARWKALSKAFRITFRERDIKTHDLERKSEYASLYLLWFHDAADCFIHSRRHDKMILEGVLECPAEMAKTCQRFYEALNNLQSEKLNTFIEMMHAIFEKLYDTERTVTSEELEKCGFYDRFRESPPESTSDPFCD